jgi:hypothetical protein
MKSTETSRVSPPKVGVVDGVAGDVAADVLAEELAQLLALAQPCGHAVETQLQVTDLPAVRDRHGGCEVTGGDPLHGAVQGAQRIGDGSSREDAGVRAHADAGAGEQAEQDEEAGAVGALLLDQSDRDAGERDARPEQPREQQAAAHAGRARGDLGQHLAQARDHGTHAPLQQQEGDGARRQPAEKHGEHAPEHEEGRDVEDGCEQHCDHDCGADPVGGGEARVAPLVAEDLAELRRRHVDRRREHRFGLDRDAQCGDRPENQRQHQVTAGGRSEDGETASCDHGAREREHADRKGDASTTDVGHGQRERRDPPRPADLGIRPL